jgi:hypothetical protein
MWVASNFSENFSDKEKFEETQASVILQHRTAV